MSSSREVLSRTTPYCLQATSVYKLLPCGSHYFSHFWQRTGKRGLEPRRRHVGTGNKHPKLHLGGLSFRRKNNFEAIQIIIVLPSWVFCYRNHAVNILPLRWWRRAPGVAPEYPEGSLVLSKGSEKGLSQSSIVRCNTLACKSMSVPSTGFLPSSAVCYDIGRPLKSPAFKNHQLPWPHTLEND